MKCVWMFEGSARKLGLRSVVPDTGSGSVQPEVGSVGGSVFLCTSVWTCSVWSKFCLLYLTLSFEGLVQNLALTLFFRTHGLGLFGQAERLYLVLLFVPAFGLVIGSSFWP